MRKHELIFDYDYRGYGLLSLYNAGTLADSVLCRSGSVNTAGKLVNCISPGDWWIKEPPVVTDEPAMSVIAGTPGWKCRLWKKRAAIYEHTRYLIHPDGGLPGTAGCIGIQGTNAEAVRHEIENALEANGVPLRVHVSKEVA